MQIKYLLENLLFISGEPMSFKKMAQILELEGNEVIAAAKELKEDFQSRGLRLIEKDNKLQIITAPEAGKYVEKLVAGHLKEELSDAALETLSAISYLGPISKAEVEELRGVNCAFSLRNLLIRGLIEKSESHSGKAALYKTSFDFIKKLGIQEEKNLPEYEKYREEIKSLISKTGSVIASEAERSVAISKD